MEQKNVAYYMYRDEQTINLNFRAMSNHPVFKEDTVFISLQNPSPEMFVGMQMDALPTIGVVEKLDPEFQDGHISQQNVRAELSYDEMLDTIAKLSGHTEDLQELRGGPKSMKKMSKIERNFGEIQSLTDFNTRCLSYKKACAIGLLPANLLIDYEKDNFEEHVETLAELDRQAKVSGQPVFYSWVNATCHPEMLKYF